MGSNVRMNVRPAGPEDADAVWRVLFVCDCAIIRANLGEIGAGDVQGGPVNRRSYKCHIGSQPQYAESRV